LEAVPYWICDALLTEDSERQTSNPALEELYVEVHPVPLVVQPARMLTINGAGRDVIRRPTDRCVQESLPFPRSMVCRQLPEDWRIHEVLSEDKGVVGRLQNAKLILRAEVGIQWHGGGTKRYKNRNKTSAAIPIQ